MRIVADIETDALINPKNIWCVVCKDLDTGEIHRWRNITDEENREERDNFKLWWNAVTLVVGHNWISYDWPCLNKLVNGLIQPQRTLDTLVLSKLFNYSSSIGHSIEDWGTYFNLPKIDFNSFSFYSKELEEYCVRDVEITEKIYNYYLKYLDDPLLLPSITLEHNFQYIVNDLTTNGFALNVDKVNSLLLKVTNSLVSLDADIAEAFPERLKLIREIHPKVTKHGTLSRTDFRWVEDGDLSIYNGGAFSRCEWTPFNPSSHRQIIDVLRNAGWKPVNKTKTHIETEREVKRLQYVKQRDNSFDLESKELHIRLEGLRVTGWKIDEDNLSTLPSTAPPPARLLTKRILLEARRRTLTEWLSLVTADNRIHGKFFGIGAWTHRMAHQNPNTANIPNSHDTQGRVKLLGKEMRSCWIAPKGRLLVGVDAEGIQLRIFAHYIDDPEFTRALVEGKKDDKTDPHSLNQRILGSVCKSRAAAKRFIYALLLGAGLSKLAEILGCSNAEAQQALDRLLARYSGWARLKEDVFPKDARKGYFVGLDGRKVPIASQTENGRKHLAMSGYLQNGESVAMKLATLKFYPELPKYDAKLVNFVHDEWQVECPNNMEKAIALADIMSDSLRVVGEDLKLKCPLAGSYWNDDLKDYTIGTNWSVTH